MQKHRNKKPPLFWWLLLIYDDIMKMSLFMFSLVYPFLSLKNQKESPGFYEGLWSFSWVFIRSITDCNQRGSSTVNQLLACHSATMHTADTESREDEMSVHLICELDLCCLFLFFSFSKKNRNILVKILLNKV